MDSFLVGYLVGRNSGDGPALPASVAVLFLIFLGFIGILLVLQEVAEVVRQFTQSNPVLSLAIVGIVSVGLVELLGGKRDLDPEKHVRNVGLVTAVVFVVFWILGELFAAQSVEQTPLIVQIPLIILTLAILGGFIKMVLSLALVRCHTTAGRLARTLSVLSIAWWGWVNLLEISLLNIPIIESNWLLLAGVVAAIGLGSLESSSDHTSGQ